MKKRARQWERDNAEMLDKEREKLQYQKDMIQLQEEFLEANGGGSVGVRVQDAVSSDDDE